MRFPPSSLALVALLGAVLLAGCFAMPTFDEPTFSFDGPADDALVGADGLDGLTFAVTVDAPSDALDEVVVLLDERDVTDATERQGNRLTYVPRDLPDGHHQVVVARSIPGGDDLESLHEWTVHVDTTPPEVSLSSPDGAVVAGEPVEVAGTTEPGATVEVAGTTTTAGEDGAFEVLLDDVESGPLAMTATDEAGNSTHDELTLVVVPSRVEVDEVRAVHVSFCGWATPSLREPVLQHIEDGLINAVQLDLKDETGKIGHATDIELAHEVGATSPDCAVDLEAAVAELHGMGVAVIGRIVAFADPTLAPWAWEHDRRDWVVQTADGDMYLGRYAGFANPASDDIVEYNLAVAEEAAAAGVDHILWDYIRKPDGPLEAMHFAGLDGESPRERLVEFIRLADERIAPYGAVHGASLYGVSNRPARRGRPGRSRHGRTPRLRRTDDLPESLGAR